MNKLEFCERCGKDIEYNIIDFDYEINYKNKNIKYKGKKALCKHCNEELFVEDVEEYNQKSFMGIYMNYCPLCGQKLDWSEDDE